jgi:predicted enzyme related to lactoylglutathione lyase
MARPMHFEIQASNPQALIDFYSALFGWSFNKWEGGDYWLIQTGSDNEPGINGGLLPRRGPPPENMAAVNAFVVTIDVADLDGLLAKVESGGSGAQVAVPKMAVPGIGWLAYVKDPDGNIFGMMQADTKAA